MTPALSSHAIGQTKINGILVLEKGGDYVMKCPECMGTSFERGHFDMAEVFQKQPVMIRNVPSSRCNQCGYLVVSSRVSKQIERVLTSQWYTLMIPAAVYDLSVPVKQLQTAMTRPI